MIAAEYLVVERQRQWWVMLNGFRQGPYVSRQIAIDSAVSSARLGLKSGRPARVSVQDSNVFETVYDFGVT